MMYFTATLILVGLLTGALDFVRPYDDEDLSTLELIERAGYPAEAHLVTTSDGYILTLHRIPGRAGSVPVLLQHGLLTSSSDWVIAGKDKALAYLLADRGYDVWMGNARGNTYSRAHTTLSTSDFEYWNFSWDEMGLYDIPAVITYITNYKCESLIYIGHSMGTTMFYVMASRRPEIADQVRTMISLAPIAYVKNVISPVRLLAPFSHSLEVITRFLGIKEFLPQNKFYKFLARHVCNIDVFAEKICSTILIFVLYGFDTAQFDYTLMPTILSHTPAGTSIKTFTHYLQEVVSGRFQAYDYGAKTNLKYYNNSTPPNYDVTKVRVPVAIFIADNDILSTIKDVKYLWQQLPQIIEIYKVNCTKFNHVDYMFAKDAPKLVYERLFSIIEKFLVVKNENPSP